MDSTNSLSMSELVCTRDLCALDGQAHNTGYVRISAAVFDILGVAQTPFSASPVLGAFSPGPSQRACGELHSVPPNAVSCAVEFLWLRCQSDV
jgi:hypothetical protein